MQRASSSGFGLVCDRFQGRRLRQQAREPSTATADSSKSDSPRCRLRWFVRDATDSLLNEEILHHRTADLDSAGHHLHGARLIVGTLDQLLLLIPLHFRPDSLLGFHVPGFGVLMSLLIIFVTGLVTANVLGQHLVRYWEALLSRIPVVKSIYNSVKRVSDTLFSTNGQSVPEGLLVQYPEGAWTIAFLTGRPGGAPGRHLSGDYVSIYVPTTPNPTSGFPDGCQGRM